MSDYAYAAKYVGLSDIENLTQMEFDNETKPSADTIISWIADVEKEVDSKLLGWGDGRSEGQGYLATNVYLDVELQRAHLEIATTYDALLLRHRGLVTGVEVLFGLYFPGISITSLARRTSGMTDTPAWESLVEGFYEGWSETSGVDFICEKSIGKCRQKHLTKIFIVGAKRPESGRARVKATLTYGWNLPLKILKRWVQLKVGLRVLDALAQSGEVTRIAGYNKGDFQEYVNTQFDNQIATWSIELGGLELNYFPTFPNTGIGILRI